MQIIKVDQKDKRLGFVDRDKAHEGKGILHRAFSVFIVNKKGEILLQQRSKLKKLWPMFWSNTCCSHPQKSETVMSAARRRLKEEFGFTVSLKEVFKFYYQASYKKRGAENELCYVLVGQYDGKIKPDKKEVAHYKWVEPNSLEKELVANFQNYTPWLKIEFKKLLKKKIL